jgi:hypothetical protein
VSDAVTQYIPYRMFAEESFRKDGYLGWNPYILGGVPFYANTMATPGDWTMQLHRCMPFWTAWHIGIVAQFLIAGLGMLVLLRGQGVSPPLALMGAVAFAGGSPFIFWVYHRWALGSFCWMPWLLWSLLKWRAGSSSLRMLWLPFLALCFLGGTLQHSALVVIGVGCVWVAWMIDPNETWRNKGRQTLFLVIGGILAAGLSAFALFPAILEFFDNVAGGHQGRGSLGYPEGALQPLLNAASYLAYPFPWLLGSPQSIDLWKVFKSDLFNVCFFGFIPTLLALILLWNRRLPLAPRLLVAAGLLIPLTPLVGPLYHRSNLLFLTGGVWLVAVALEKLEPAVLRALARILGAVFLAASAIWLATSVIFTIFRPQLQAFLKSVILSRSADSQFGIFAEWLQDRSVRWLDSLPIWTFFSLVPWVLAGGGLVCLYFVGSPRGLRARWALTAIVFVEVTLSGARWVTFVDPKLYPPYPPQPAIAWLKSHLGEGRLSLPAGSMASRPFPPNTLIPYGIPSLQGYESIHPRFSIGEKTAETLTDRENRERGVSVVALTGNSPPAYAHWEKFAEGSGLNFLLPRERASRYLAEGSVGTVDCLVEQETPNRRVIISPPETRRLLFLENWDPGWQATVDEKNKLPVERSSNGTMYVDLPFDQNITRVEFRYLPIWRIRGAGITLASALGFLALLALSLQKGPARLAK